MRRAAMTVQSIYGCSIERECFTLSGAAECRQQYFRVRPQDIEVAEGGTAVIACEVGNREGRVQWTRDGLTLGKARGRREAL